jgi:uncharacterized protein (DUF4415 family)
MTDERITKAVSIDGEVFVEQPDGSLRPAKGLTDWEKLAAMSEEEIEAAALSDEDNPPITDEQWQCAVRLSRKQYIHIGIDDDVLKWFKSTSTRGYQTKINAVLRQYVTAQQKGESR